MRTFEGGNFINCAIREVEDERAHSLLIQAVMGQRENGEQADMRDGKKGIFGISSERTTPQLSASSRGTNFFSLEDDNPFSPMRQFIPFRAASDPFGSSQVFHLVTPIILFLRLGTCSVHP